MTTVHGFQCDQRLGEHGERKFKRRNQSWVPEEGGNKIVGRGKLPERFKAKNTCLAHFTMCSRANKRKTFLQGHYR